MDREDLLLCVNLTLPNYKRKKYDYLLKQTRTAGRERWFLRVILAAICKHLDAWLALSERSAASP